MRGDDDALLFRDRLDRRLHFALKRVEFLGIGGGIGLVAVATLSVGGAEGVGDVLHIDLGIGDRLEGMRIGLAISMGAFSGIGIGEFGFEVDWRDALGQNGDRRLGGAGVDQALQKAFEMQAVDQHHIRTRHRHRVSRARLVDVGIAIRPDDGGQIDPVAADIFGEIGNDREAGDHFQRLREGR